MILTGSKGYTFILVFDVLIYIFNIYFLCTSKSQDFVQSISIFLFSFPYSITEKITVDQAVFKIYRGHDSVHRFKSQ